MTALLLIDIQNDFMPGGPLGVPDGHSVIGLANTLIPHFPLVVATQDWHPSNHESFAANHTNRQPGEVIDLHGLPQVLWPTHCVQNTPGADFAVGLNTDRIDFVVQKGMNPAVDSYSGFFDNGGKNPTTLLPFLSQKGVETVYLCGVATDYCVRFTALDAVKAGFKTVLIEDAARGVELNPGDIASAIEEMTNAGISCIQHTALLQ